MTHEAVIEEIKGRLQILESSLQTTLDGIAISKSQMPFKALWYREAVAWRMAELSRAAIEEIENGRFVAGILLTRAAIETTAGLWFLRKKIEATLESKNLDQMNEHLNKLNVGSKTIPELNHQPFNVLTFVDRVNKDIDGFRERYDYLSEVAHPNWAGVTLPYSKLDPEPGIVAFGSHLRTSTSQKGSALFNLSGALRLFEASYNAIAGLMPQFASVCESGLKERNA